MTEICTFVFLSFAVVQFLFALILKEPTQEIDFLFSHCQIPLALNKIISIPLREEYEQKPLLIFLECSTP